MSTEAKTTKAKVKNRIPLSDECFKRLHHWMLQFGESFKGVDLRPSDLIEWLVRSHSEVLNQTELLDLREKYWDDIAVANWALKELKRAKAAGERVSLRQILGEYRKSPNSASCPRKKVNAENPKKGSQPQLIPTADDNRVHTNEG